MKALFSQFVRDEAGQDLVEYGLLVGLITAAVVTAITSIGGKVTSYFTFLDGQLIMK
jgi:pilus assembly protein Flp/PilA